MTTRKAWPEDATLPDEPDMEFHGTVNKPLHHKMLSEGKINGTEFALLAIIDHLSNNRDRGCWASNDYLAKLCGVRSRQLQYMVHHLLGETTVKRGQRDRKGVPLLVEMGSKIVAGKRRRVLALSHKVE